MRTSFALKGIARACAGLRLDAGPLFATTTAQGRVKPQCPLMFILVSRLGLEPSSVRITRE